MIDFGLFGPFKLAFYYASYLYFPAALLLAFVIARRRGRVRALAALALGALTILAYARFIEPRILLTVEHKASLGRCLPQAGSVRVAVFSDTHEGIFGNAIPIARIARRVGAADADLVLIAGDFTYYLEPEKFAETFAALGAISAPVVGALGNHDIGLPGPNVGKPLTASLEEIGVILLDNERREFTIHGATIEVVGLSDLWGKQQDRTLLEKRGAAPRLVLTHNPQTLMELLPRQSVDFLFAGPTHGGQINIPFVTCALMPGICRVARYGLAETPRGPVFVTSGTGMIGLPMRFNVPPVIDVITVKWNACVSNS
ncbi:MAG: metallophosphoesterase [Parvularculaceae bacterium]